MSKTFQERAKEYAPDAPFPDEILPAREEYLVKLERNGYIVGATEEHELLTRWNSSDVLPEDNQWILVKVVNENNGVLYYTTTKFYSEYFNGLKECRYTILGWREIHE